MVMVRMTMAMAASIDLAGSEVRPPLPRAAGCAASLDADDRAVCVDDVILFAVQLIHGFIVTEEGRAIPWKKSVRHAGDLFQSPSFLFQ